MYIDIKSKISLMFYLILHHCWRTEWKKRESSVASTVHTHSQSISKLLERARNFSRFDESLWSPITIVITPIYQFNILAI